MDFVTPRARTLLSRVRRLRGEHRWPAQVAVLAIAGLQLVLPADLGPRPQWVLPGIEVVLLIVLFIADPGRLDRESTMLRTLGLGLVAVASAANAYSVYLLILEIAEPHDGGTLRLLTSGGTIWLTNVIVFALWYWELDRGGPAARYHSRREHPDFLFSAMVVRELTPEEWRPSFIDYLFLSFTNATAFSPTDTLPLTRVAKLAMMFQSAISFTVVILVIARAINQSAQGG
jgi:uncharacterized membrane protein